MIVILPLFRVMTNFNIEEKDLVCLISCVSLHFQKWTGNPSKWVKLKTNTHGANEWNGEAVFFSQERNGFHKTSSVVTFLSWYLLHSIFSKQKSLNRAAINLYDNFFPFDHKQYPPQFVWYKLAYSGETVRLFFPSGFSKFQLATWPVNPSQKPA